MEKENNNNVSVLGILSIVFAALGWAVFGIILEPLGLIFGIIGIATNKKDVLSVIGMCVSVVGLISCITMFIR